MNNVKNAIKNFIEIGKLQHDRARITPDSVLTDIGVEQASELGLGFRERFQAADIVLASELRRCMETGALACRYLHKSIHIVPYVSEVDTTYDNCAIEFNKQYMEQHMDKYLNPSMTIDEAVKTRAYSQQYMKQHYPVSQGFPKIDNSILLSFDGDKPKPTVSDHKKFYADIVPIIYRIVSDKPGFVDSDGVRTYRVLLFSHSGHLKKHFGIDGKPLGAIDMTKDPRYVDKMDQFVSPERFPHNTNIYTEVIELDIAGNQRCRVAEPCDCGKRCQDWHQIRLSDQNVVSDTHWCDIDIDGVKRCYSIHRDYDKYMDKIRSRDKDRYDSNPSIEMIGLNSKEQYEQNKLNYRYLIDVLNNMRGIK